MLFYVGIFLLIVGALGVGVFAGRPAGAPELSKLKIALIMIFFILGAFITLDSSFSINRGEPISTLEIGKEYRILESYNDDTKDYLLIDDNSGAPRLYIVDQDKLEGHMPFGRFVVIKTPTGQRINFF